MCHRLIFLAKVPSLRIVLSNTEKCKCVLENVPQNVLKMSFLSPTAFDDIINELSRISGVYDMYHCARHLALKSQYVFPCVNPN